MNFAIVVACSALQKSQHLRAFSTLSVARLLYLMQCEAKNMEGDDLFPEKDLHFQQDLPGIFIGSHDTRIIWGGGSGT